MKTRILASVASMFFVISIAGCESVEKPFSLTGDEETTEITTMTYSYDASNLKDQDVEAGY